MIMGLGLSCHAWDALPERLATRMRVLAFDHRGTGFSGPASWACSMAQLASDARAVLDAESIPAAFVFGISMGGMVAQELALRWPERVRALALGATFASFRASEKLSLDALLDLILLNCGPRFATADRVGRLLVSPPFRERAWNWLRGDVGQARTLRSGLSQLAAVVRHGPAERLRALKVPTLVISGADDPSKMTVILINRATGPRTCRVTVKAFPFDKATLYRLGPDKPMVVPAGEVAVDRAASFELPAMSVTVAVLRAAR